MIEVGRLKALTEKVRPPEPEPAALEESLAWLRQRAASRTEDGSHAHE